MVDLFLSPAAGFASPSLVIVLICRFVFASAFLRFQGVKPRRIAKPSWKNRRGPLSPSDSTQLAEVLQRDGSASARRL
jgi:hypothetical protein